MRSLHFIPAVLIAIGCTPEQQVLNEQVQVEGVVPADVEMDEMTQEFLASGAQFGVIVDPATGDTVALTNLERANISSDFSLADAPACLDCGGVNATCTGPAGFGRQISVPLTRNTGSGPVDVAYTGLRNWSPTGQDCDGSSCPTPIASPTTFDVDLFGNLNTCSSFAVYFNADDGASGPTPQSATASPGTAITDNSYDGTEASMTCANLTIPPGAGTVQGNMQIDLSINHTWVGDLNMKLFAPDDTVLTVMHRPGATHASDTALGNPFGNGADLATAFPISFSDGAATDAEAMGTAIAVVCSDDGLCDFDPNPDSAGTPPNSFGGAFNGVGASGTWRFCVADMASGDLGTLESVTLSFNSQP